MIWITAEQVIAVHAYLISETGGTAGIRDKGGLDAAIAAPLQSFDGVDLFHTILEKIASIGYGLAANHAFVDGNKRIGAMVTQLPLRWNGYILSLQENELADMFIAIAAGKASEEDLLHWLKEKTNTQ